MTEQIGIRLAELLEPIVPFYLSEAETDEYPYAVYDMNVSPVMVKDRVYKFTADVSIEVYGKEPDQVKEISDDIRSAIDEEMRGDTFFASLVTFSDQRQEGLWISRLDYTINQKKEYNGRL